MIKNCKASLKKYLRIFLISDFIHQALFNPRLITTGGRYLLYSHNIEINKKYLDQLGMDELIGIIKHELCHYHLHLEGKGYKHRIRILKIASKGWWLEDIVHLCQKHRLKEKKIEF